jgi:superfamily II DNA or RNA helicase
MARASSRSDPESTGALLFRLNRGEILGMLPKDVAERGYRLYQERHVSRITWLGDDLEAELEQPLGRIRLSPGNGSGTPFDVDCTSCDDALAPCPHAVAALLQWIDIRPTMRRLGAGAVWRGNSRHPFLAPSGSAAERVDLSHLTGPDLRSALELQISLQRTGTCTARLAEHAVEIHITLPSGDHRVVCFSATVLPSVLPLLRSMPRVRLDGDLDGLELSQARLHPVLRGRWEDDAIILEPGYRLADGTLFVADSLEGQIHGRWARIGDRLCRVLDPATPLVAFHRRGRQELKGRDALRFLNLDHPQLKQHGWYVPEGHLARYRQPRIPKPVALAAESTPNGKVRIRPRFTVDERPVVWTTALELLEAGFSRLDGALVRAPDMAIFERAGFKLPRREQHRGTLGSRLAFVRLVAETGLPVDDGDEDLIQLAAVLQGRGLPDPGTAPGLRSILRPYQRDGVAWMWARYLAGVGALLADDMGLGKTHQIMALLCHVMDRKPTARALVICPRGVLEHWATLLEEFAPELEVHTFHGPGRSLDGLERGGVVVLTTYDIVIRSADELSEQAWEVAVFDEAQRIKNPRTKAARAAKRLEAGFRVALSGTPLENRLLELWSVVDLIMPGYLGSERDFRTTYRNPTNAQLHRLRQRLKVLTLRRVKEQVLDDLPDKVEDVRFCRLLPDQERLYRRIWEQRADEIAERLRDQTSDIPYMHIFALLTRLKQVCDHPWLVDEEAPSGSGKLEVFEQIVDEALASDLRIVVFSQYVQMIGLLSRILERRGIAHLVLTGETRDRSKVVRRFNSEQHERVLLASLLAGGVGIDLTGASVVIHYDRWWNPAKENQATDRVHRIGQKRFVQVFKLLTRDTIEERIDSLIRTKAELMEQVVGPTEDVLRTFGREDMARLLGIELGPRS